MSEARDFGAGDVEPVDEDAIRTAGSASRVYHESDVGSMESVHDDRNRSVVINDNVIPDAGSLLVDTVEYPPGVSCPEHYHEGSDHFFYVLSGDGGIVIEGDEMALTTGTLAWVGDGDRHWLYADEDGDGMVVFEFFSDSDCETVWTSGPQCTWQPADD